MRNINSKVNHQQSILHALAPSTTNPTLSDLESRYTSLPAMSDVVSVALRDLLLLMVVGVIVVFVGRFLVFCCAIVVVAVCMSEKYEFKGQPSTINLALFGSINYQSNPLRFRVPVHIPSSNVRCCQRGTA